MLTYFISYSDIESRFIQLRFSITQIHQDTLYLQLPSWRPGRYELQNFAKNIRKFRIVDDQGKNIRYTKTTKDRWEIYTKGVNEINIEYEYFANQPDAGGSFICNEYLYINPVNCMMYVEGRMDEQYTLHFSLPNDYRIASQLTLISNHTLSAPGFDYLADSPLIASSSLELHSISGTFNAEPFTINLCFQGKHPFDVERLKNDTLTYVKFQIETMGDMPAKEFHFIYLMHEQPFRHGVEHLNSTVIAMGQFENQTTEEYYNDLLAISSHEFFHLWNIKRIRPVEMWPYDFTKENYSTLGYVYEGITTYLGDLFLLHSGVWSEEQYLHSLSGDMLRHFNNEGRHNYSLAESSWDTWLDGYVPGVKGRKISIYIEGLIAAWCADVILIEETKGKFRLYDVMKEMYRQFYKHQKGYSAEDYKHILELFSGTSFNTYFDELILGKGHFDRWVEKITSKLGVQFVSNTLLNTLIIINKDIKSELNRKWIDN
jgi:predicted metalloprotease with PDZ domain